MYTSFDDTMRALNALQQSMDRSMRGDWFGSRTASRGSRPAINVFEKGDDIVVLAEVPGAGKDDFAIQVQNDTIRISGKRKLERDGKASAHRLERRSFDFDRSLTLPFNVDEDAVQASYRDGVLAILLPRSAAHKARTVAVS